MKISAEYRKEARDNLKGNWGTAILVCLIVALVTDGLSMVPVVGWFLSTLFAGQFIVGELIYFIKLNRKQDAGVGSIFQDFGKNWIDNFLTYLLQQAYTILWMFLFIVPGLVKMYSYSMTMYLKSQNPQMGHNEAITLSRKLMDGNKYRLFCLHFSFIGWALLSVLTFGIGFIWLLPYMQSSIVAFYEDIYTEYTSKNESVEDTSASQNQIEEQ